MDRIITLIILGVIVAAAGLILWRLWQQVRPVTIYDFQQGLLYKHGRFVRQLDAGRYWKFGSNSSIFVLDMREGSITLGGQEMLSADNLSVKASLEVRYRLVDALKAHSATTSWQDFLYADAQGVLRDAIVKRPLEQVLAERTKLSAEIFEGLKSPADALGLEVVSAQIRDLMLSGETKRAFADIFRAKLEGEAALERARGETAALRSLANGARMVKDNPALYDIRLLQVLQGSAAKGATIILNASGRDLPFVADGSGDVPSNEKS